MVRCLRATQSSRHPLKLSQPHNGILTKTNVKQTGVAFEVEVWFHVTVKQKEVLYRFFFCIKQKRTGELCCGVIRAWGYTDNRFLNILFKGDKGALLNIPRHWGDNSHQQCFVMCLVFSAYFFPSYFLASKREITLICRLQIVCLCAAHCPPSPLSSTCSVGIKLDLHSFSFFHRPLSLVSRPQFVLLEPSEGVMEDTQNSHYNEQWQDVTHSAIDQPPARCCHPCTHLHPSSWVCLFVWCHPHAPLFSAEPIGLLMVLQQGSNIHSLLQGSDEYDCFLII